VQDLRQWTEHDPAAPQRIRGFVPVSYVRVYAECGETQPLCALDRRLKYSPRLIVDTNINPLAVDVRFP
jgi:hypothetical protein